MIDEAVEREKKRQKRLLQNRISAALSRKKKKEYLEKLEKENEDLKKELSSLKEQVTASRKDQLQIARLRATNAEQELVIHKCRTQISDLMRELNKLKGISSGPTDGLSVLRDCSLAGGPLGQSSLPSLERGLPSISTSMDRGMPSFDQRVSSLPSIDRTVLPALDRGRSLHPPPPPPGPTSRMHSSPCAVHPPAPREDLHRERIHIQSSPSPMPHHLHHSHHPRHGQERKVFIPPINQHAEI